MDSDAAVPQATSLPRDIDLTAEQRELLGPYPFAAKVPGTAQSKQQSRAPDNFWLTPAEASERARLSKSHLLRLVRTGCGPTHVGERRLMRFRASDVDAWVSGGCR